MEISSSHGQELDRQLLIRYKENALDLDILVDDLRRERDDVEERLRLATKERDAAVARLQDMVDRMQSAA